MASTPSTASFTRVSRRCERAASAAVDPGPVVYAGFSLGAILGIGELRRGRIAASLAVLIEGGAAEMTDGVIWGPVLAALRREFPRAVAGDGRFGVGPP